MPRSRTTTERGGEGREGIGEEGEQLDHVS